MTSRKTKDVATDISAEPNPGDAARLKATGAVPSAETAPAPAPAAVQREGEFKTMPVSAFLLLNARAGQRLKDKLDENKQPDPWVSFGQLALIRPIALMQHAIGLWPKDRELPPDLSTGSPVRISARRYLKPDALKVNEEIEEAFRMLDLSAMMLWAQQISPDPESRQKAAQHLCTATNLLCMRSGDRFNLDPMPLLDQFILESVILPEVAERKGWSDDTQFEVDPLGPLWREWDKQALFAGAPIEIVRPAVLSVPHSKTEATPTEGAISSKTHDNAPAVEQAAPAHTDTDAPSSGANTDEETIARTVIIAFFLQPQETLGGQAEALVDLSGADRWKQKLRGELGLMGVEVRVFTEDQWRMPQIRSADGIYDQKSLAEIVGSMAISLDELGVADEVVKKYIQGDFENLRLPTSGRVILFQAIEAPRSHLGRLLDPGKP